MNVALFDANEPPSLAFCRSLGRQGVGVTVFSPSKISVAGASKYCRQRRTCPELTDFGRFLPWLERQVARGDIDCIAPTSDLVCFYISCVLDKLSPESQRVLPSVDALRGVLFKDRFVPANTDAAIQPPKTVAPRSVEEAHAQAGDLVYPCVIKPRSHVATPKSRGHLVRTADEFRARYQRADVDPALVPAVDLFPELALPVVQRWVPSRPHDLITVAGFLDEEGNAVVMTGAKKTAQWPPRTGIGLLFAPHDVKDIVSEVETFVRHRVGRGIFELELVPTGADKWIALDLNPRGYGQMHLDIARGVDLPGMWAATLAGRAPAVVEGYAGPVRDDVRFAHGVPLAARAIARAVRRKNGRWPLASFRRDVEGAVGVVHDDRDPLPSAVYVGAMLRHPGGLIRPFMAR